MPAVTDTVGRCAGKRQNQDRGLRENIQNFSTGLVEKLRSAVVAAGEMRDGQKKKH